MRHGLGAALEMYIFRTRRALPRALSMWAAAEARPAKLWEEPDSHGWTTYVSTLSVRVERVAASHKLHVLVARRLIVGKVLPPIDGHLEPRLPFVDQDLCKEAIIPAVTAIFRVMSRVKLCAVGLPTTRTCAQQCCARSVVPEHWCWAIVVGTTHWWAGECVAFAPFGGRLSQRTSS